MPSLSKQQIQTVCLVHLDIIRRMGRLPSSWSVKIRARIACMDIPATQLVTTAVARRLSETSDTKN